MDVEASGRKAGLNGSVELVEGFSTLLARSRTRGEDVVAGEEGNGKRGEKAELELPEADVEWPGMKTGDAVAGAVVPARVSTLSDEPLREDARDESFEGSCERRTSEREPDPESDAGDGARVPCGVLGSCDVPIAPGLLTKPGPGRLSAPPKTSLTKLGPLGRRKSCALSTDSGTRCRLIDSFGGGGAGNGDGIETAIAAEREERGEREADGDRGA